MNVIAVKCKQFAIRIVKLCRYLQTEKQEYILTKQLIRSGTSIGANVYEATQAFSHADFLHKMSIALKESVETEYWLELFHETDLLSTEEFQSIYTDNKELSRLLTAIINTARRTEDRSQYLK